MQGHRNTGTQGQRYSGTQGTGTQIQRHKDTRPEGHSAKRLQVVPEQCQDLFRPTSPGLLPHGRALQEHPNRSREALPAPGDLGTLQDKHGMQVQGRDAGEVTACRAGSVSCPLPGSARGPHLVEADDGLGVDADDVQAPAVALQQLSKQAQEHGPDLLVLQQGKHSLGLWGMAWACGAQPGPVGHGLGLWGTGCVHRAAPGAGNAQG